MSLVRWAGLAAQSGAIVLELLRNHILKALNLGPGLQVSSKTHARMQYQ
jgi:hypothetical protein